MTHHSRNRVDLDYKKNAKLHKKAKYSKKLKSREEVIEKHQNKERFFKKTHLIQPTTNQNPMTPKSMDTKLSFEIDMSVFLLLIQNMLKENKITVKQLEALIAGAKETEDKTAFKIVDPNNPNRVFTLNKHSGKGEIRDYWMYLMKQGQLFCDICGYPIDTTKGRMALTYDHIQPRSRGGKTDAKNGSPAHQVCNGLKSNILPETWERIGLDILKEHGIKVDPRHTLYQYMRTLQR